MSGLDDLDQWIIDEVGEEAWEKALDDARERIAREINLRCAYGNCVQWYDPVTRKIMGGMGPVGCPCENLPGWRSARPAGMSRPAVPVKTKGRHGSRVQRSLLRHRLPIWIIRMNEEDS